MSSLRISHQNRTIGATPAGGDTGRSEHADDRSSFAVALGVAGAAPKAATTLLGGQTGEASPGPAHLRKRADAPGKLDDVASLAAQAALGLPANVDAPVKPEERQGKPADAIATVGQNALAADALGAVATTAIAAVAGVASNVAGEGNTVVPGSSVNPLVATGAATAAVAGGSVNPLPVAGPITTGITDGLINPLAATGAAIAGINPLAAPGAAVEVQPGIPILSGAAPDNTATALTGTAVSLQLAFAPPVPTASGAASQIGSNVPDRRALAPVTLDAGQPSVGQAQTAPTAAGDATTAVAPVAPGAVASAIAIASSIPTPGHVVAPGGQAADLTSVAAPAGTTADATGAGSPPSPALAPSPDALHVTPSLLANLSPSLLSSVAGPPSTGAPGGGAFGAQTRARFTPVAAATDATSTAAAVLDSNAGTAALAAVPTAASGSVVDAAAGGAISDQVAGHLVRLVSSGSSDMVMRLHPPELGDLTIRVAVSGHDVSAWFTSPQPEVQNAISAAIGQLQTDLGTAGYNLNGAWVGADASSAQQQSAGAPAPPPPRMPASAASLALPAAVASRPAASGLNIYV